MMKLKVKLKDENGLDIFQDVKTTNRAVKISEVILQIEENKVTILDILKGKE